MTILCDWEITKLATEVEMVNPFIYTAIRTIDNNKIISKGLSTYGYDISLANSFKTYINNTYINNTQPPVVVDPLDFDEDNLLETIEVVDNDHIIIEPYGYMLSHSVEYIKMPRDVAAICLTKSTYARCGIFLNTTPIEPGWEGQITLEISNLTNRPCKLYINQGICQLMFFNGKVPNTDYGQKNGKYQGQTGITLPR